jgi:hypothetical protein
VKQLRIFTYHFAYQGMGGILGVVGLDGPWDIKRVLGTVPVEKDGSAMFRVPANTPISVQPLDAEGKALQIMRSWMTAMPGEVLYSVKDLVTDAYVLKNAAETSGEEGQFFDGIQLTIERFQQVAPWPDSSGWKTASGGESECSWDIAVSAKQALPSDYEIRFTDQGDTSFTKMVVPFEIWNMTLGEKIDFIVAPSPTDTTAEMRATWTSGDNIGFLEKVGVRPLTTWSIVLTIDSTMVVDGSDTSYVTVAPKTGDVVSLVSQKPFYAGDRFKLYSEDNFSSR